MSRHRRLLASLAVYTALLGGVIALGFASSSNHQAEKPMQGIRVGWSPYPEPVATVTIRVCSDSDGSC